MTKKSLDKEKKIIKIIGIAYIIVGILLIILNGGRGLIWAIILAITGYGLLKFQKNAYYWFIVLFILGLIDLLTSSPETILLNFIQFIAIYLVPGYFIRKYKEVLK